MSTVMENRAPFKLMFGYRLMKDEKGEEMHKSKGNAVEFNEAAEKEGADAMRWLFASHNPEHDLRFGYAKIHEARRQLLMLWNVYEFFLTYSRIDKFDPTDSPVPVSSRTDLDRWILCRLQKLVQSAHLNYGRYSVHILMRDAVSFIDALSRWYLRRSRRRFWKSKNDSDKMAAYQTLWECLVTAIKVLAPIIPLTTEEMYQQLVRANINAEPISIHLCDFPQANEALIDAQLLDGMDSILELVEQAHAARNAAGIKVRQPLAEMRVVVREKGLDQRMKPYLPLVLDELNIKSVNFPDSIFGLYEVSVRLDAKKGKPKYGRLFAPLQEALMALPVSFVESNLTAGKGLTLRVENEDIELSNDEVIVKKLATGDWALAEGNGMLVLVDTRLTEELIREGNVRDLVRHIQKLRKEIGMNVTDRISIEYVANDEIAAAVSVHAEYISSETLATGIERKDAPQPGYYSLTLGSDEVSLGLNGANGPELPH
jgi:isoleucyl-tRNA synthetase